MRRLLLVALLLAALVPAAAYALWRRDISFPVAFGDALVTAGLALFGLAWIG